MQRINLSFEPATALDLKIPKSRKPQDAIGEMEVNPIRRNPTMRVGRLDSIDRKRHSLVEQHNNIDQLSVSVSLSL